eukprot:2071505-Amphidinium_carterae.1
MLSSEDAEIEDKFFAKALEAQNLTAVEEAEPAGWADFSEVHPPAVAKAPLGNNKEQHRRPNVPPC